MAKYRKFYYSAGYVGTDTEVIMKFADSYTEEEIEKIFEDWAEEQRCDARVLTEVSEDDVDENNIEDEYE